VLGSGVPTCRIAIVCSGLGVIRRGYESFFPSFAEQLCDDPRLDIHLYKGGGPDTASETRVWNLPRHKRLAEGLGKLLRLGQPMLGRGYYVEQASFLLFLLPHLERSNPDVIYFSDKDLGDMLARWKRFRKKRWRLVFRNGGPYPPPYPLFDTVQQLTAPMYEKALAAGCPTEQQRLLTQGFDMSAHANFVRFSETQRRELKRNLGLPPDRPGLLAVSAVNRSHKRIDYLIRELAALPAPRPFLQLLGQVDRETPALIELGQRLLGNDGIDVRTVAATELTDYYQAADLFALASVREGFGRVMVEALLFGLPCIVHDYPVSRFVLGEQGYYADLTVDGNLTQMIERLVSNPEPEREPQRHREAFQRFNWAQVLPQYVEMLCLPGVGWEGPSRVEN